LGSFSFKTFKGVSGIIEGQDDATTGMTRPGPEEGQGDSFEGGVDGGIVISTFSKTF
jgi:hypothetical protein